MLLQMRKLHHQGKLDCRRIKSFGNKFRFKDFLVQKILKFFISEWDSRRGPEMDLHDNSVSVLWQMDMVLRRWNFWFREQFQIQEKRFYAFATAFNPKIYITALTTQRIWIKSSICSTLQNCRTPPHLMKNFRKAHRFLVHATIHISSRFGMCRPAHQYWLWRTFILGKLVYRRKNNI